MKIFVCLKQVPDTDTRIKIQGDFASIDANGIKWIVSPYDLYAIEEAIKIRESNPGTQVYVITAGPKPRASEALITALAMGADEGILINVAQPLDANQTAKVLAATIKSEGGAKSENGARLILTGRSSGDYNQSSVAQMLAEYLEIPHATVISKLQFSPDSVLVERDIEGGAKEVIQLKLPAVISANKGLNSPRYSSLPGIMKAKKKTIKEIDFTILGVSAEDFKVKYSNFTLPPDKPAARLISGDVPSQVSQLVKVLRDEAKVL